ncbi:hypothetical protein F2981_28945 (plasmid) [Sinorhizobium meliloti]|nr:hypothetical protein [Sinorhizobium meliloti]
MMWTRVLSAHVTLIVKSRTASSARRRRRTESGWRVDECGLPQARRTSARVDIGIPEHLRHVRMRAAEANLRRFDCPMNIRPASSFGGSARSFP